MYQNAQTTVKCPAGITEGFSVQVGVHQGSVLSPFLFNIVFDYLLKDFVTEPNVTSLFFADDVALISNNVADLQRTLDKWRGALEENGFRISRSKTEQLSCMFLNPLSLMPDIYLDGIVLQKCSKFKYLGSVVNQLGDFS